MLRNEHALNHFIDEFNPEFIAAELRVTNFETLRQAYQQFQPVFFDDQFVLYANRDHAPELVSKHLLKYVNPHSLLDDTQGTLEQRIDELVRVKQQFPEGDRVQHALVRLLLKAERYEEALGAAYQFLDSHPENPNSHYLVGATLEFLDRCDEGVPYFNDTFALSDQSFHRTIHRHLGTCAYLRKDFDAAYAHFSKAIISHEVNIDPAHRFQYALSAVAVGDTMKARMLLKHLLYTADPTDQEIITKARALLHDLLFTTSAQFTKSTRMEIRKTVRSTA